jgi:hypothetical protein
MDKDPKDRLPAAARPYAPQTVNDLPPAALLRALALTAGVPETARLSAAELLQRIAQWHPRKDET